MGFEAKRKAATGTGIANPHPVASKAVTDRAAMMAEIAVRRRRAQMRARHALDAPDAKRVAEPMAA